MLQPRQTISESSRLLKDDPSDFWVDGLLVGALGVLPVLAAGATDALLACDLVETLLV
jgi:hypothetical protein